MEDSDEGIVLSDLLRTGEASRLRRRGAIRDHIHRHPPPPASHEQSQTTYRLFCRGGECPDSSGNEIARWSNEPFTPELFSSPTREPAATQHRMQTPVTGITCGALVHSTASTSYTADTEPSTTVIPLDAVYFDREEPDFRLGIDPCGCVREGLGCSVCGTPLGTRWQPCKPSASSTTIYSFFSDAVYAQKSPQPQPMPNPEFLSQAQAQPQAVRPPPRRRPTRIGEDEVNAALAVLESSASNDSPSPISPISSEEELEDFANTEDPSDPELAWALAMPWFGFSISLPEDLEGCDVIPTTTTRDSVVGLDDMDVDSMDDIEGYLERRIGGLPFECRGDDDYEEELYHRYREEYDSHDDYDPPFYPPEEPRERSLSSRRRARTLSSPSSPYAPQMSRSFAYSRFR